MAEAGDKTEAPTPRRRQEAREQGNIARSPDLTTALLLIAAIVMLDWFGPGLMGAMRLLMEGMLGEETLVERGTATIGVYLLGALRLVVGAMAPLLLGMMGVAVLANVVQVGFVLNPNRLAPKLSALSPLSGLSRIFSNGNGTVQLAQNLLKLVLISLVAYSAVRGRLNDIVRVQEMEFIQIFMLGGAMVYSIALRIGVLMLALSVLDYGWQKWRNEKQLRMTKQEVKEEMRRMEGDPQLRHRRRQIAMQRMKQSAKKHVPEADVVVTNPTHYAVALKYDSSSMHAPRVVAKGADGMAMLIRQIAVEHGVPILERAPLARGLFRMVDVGQEIPEQFYSAVAEILAYVYELSGKGKLAATGA